MDNREISFMFYGLGAAWLILAIYVLLMVGRLQRVQKQIDTLKRMMDDRGPK